MAPLCSLCLTLTACASPMQSSAPSIPEDMVMVPAGWFSMGQDEGHQSNQPQHQVYLDAFAIDRTEVTKAAFARFVSDTGYRAKGWNDTTLSGRAHEPVVGVAWRDADAFCRWKGRRLPSEAEWEKAARGTDGRRYPWGNTWDADCANTAEMGQQGVLPVGSLPDGASPYGALDMAGNAAEWVNDYFAADYYTYSPDHDPTGPNIVTDRGLRGGSWASPSEHAQTFFRDSSHSARPNPRVGFRCAQSLSVADE